MSFVTPLRYPGGKRRLANFIKLIFHSNDLLDGDYVEPYAGGASVALTLLLDGYARRIYINDINRSVYSFWDAVLNQTDALCQLIRDTPITLEEWRRQKSLQSDRNASPLELGFSTFFLNRTNHSGIITAGVIGGLAQQGKWLIDARFNKEELIARIQRIGRYRRRIHLYNHDAIDFVREVQPQLADRSLTYFDPPYFVKGTEQLYTNFYIPDDHSTVAAFVSELQTNWIVSYDDAPTIRQLYSAYRIREYDLHYSAQDRYRGNEVMFFHNALEIPEVTDPAKVTTRDIRKYQQQLRSMPLIQQILGI